MTAEKIDVTCYSGYRLNEKPIKFIYKGKEYLVEEILERSVYESIDGKDRRLTFRLRCRDKKIFSIYYDFCRDEWYLEETGK